MREQLWSKKAAKTTEMRELEICPARLGKAITRNRSSAAIRVEGTKENGLTRYKIARTWVAPATEGRENSEAHGPATKNDATKSPTAIMSRRLIPKS